MKTSYFIPTLLFLFSISFAQEQLQPGVYTLGGNISLSTNSSDLVAPGPNMEPTIVGTSVNTVFSFGPNVEVFVMENLQIGGALQYSSQLPSPGTGITITGVKSFSASVSPSIRYYIPIAPSYAAFVSASGGAMWVRTELPGYATTFSKPTWTYGFATGLNHFLTQSAAIEVAVAYNAIKRNTIGLNSTFGLRFGFRYFVL